MFYLYNEVSWSTSLTIARCVFRTVSNTKMESFAIIANGWKRKAVNYFRKTLHFAPQGFEFASTGEGKKKPLGKTKRTQNQSKKVKHTTISSKGIMPYLEEYFSLQKSCNETNKSDEKCQENNQEEEEERNFLWNVNVKLMQRTMFGFKVITAISRHMFIASYIFQIILKIFTKFKGKHLRQDILFNKVATFRCFPVSLWNI